MSTRGRQATRGARVQSRAPATRAQDRIPSQASSTNQARTAVRGANPTPSKRRAQARVSTSTRAATSLGSKATGRIAANNRDIDTATSLASVTIAIKRFNAYIKTILAVNDIITMVERKLDKIDRISAANKSDQAPKKLVVEFDIEPPPREGEEVVDAKGVVSIAKKSKFEANLEAYAVSHGKNVNATWNQAFIQAGTEITRQTVESMREVRDQLLLATMRMFRNGTRRAPSALGRKPVVAQYTQSLSNLLNDSAELYKGVTLSVDGGQAGYFKSPTAKSLFSAFTKKQPYFGNTKRRSSAALLPILDEVSTVTLQIKDVTVKGTGKYSILNDKTFGSNPQGLTVAEVIDSNQREKYFIRACIDYALATADTPEQLFLDGTVEDDGAIDHARYEAVLPTNLRNNQRLFQLIDKALRNIAKVYKQIHSTGEIPDSISVWAAGDSKKRKIIQDVSAADLAAVLQRNAPPPIRESYVGNQEATLQSVLTAQRTEDIKADPVAYARIVRAVEDDARLVNGGLMPAEEIEAEEMSEGEGL